MQAKVLLIKGFVGLLLVGGCTADHEKENTSMDYKHLTPQALRLEDGTACGPVKSKKISYDICRMIESHEPSTEFEVLVVVDAPQPDVSAFIGSNVDWSTASVEMPDKTVIAQVKLAVEEKLRDLGEPDAKWLDNAQAFVADLDALEMDKIAELPEVLEIVPNARLR